VRFSECGWTRVATHAVRNGRWQAWAAWPWLWLGLCAGPLRAQVEVFWGYPLKKVDTEGGNLQDHGLHLQCVVAAF